MRVAVIQFKPTFKDKKGNIERLSALIVEAARNGAKVICAPELATTGYSFMSEEEARPFAESPQWLDDWNGVSPCTMMGRALSISRNLQVTITFGFVEVDLGTNKLYNSQVFIGPDGYHESYRKICPFGNDYIWAGRGQSNPPVIRTTIDGEQWKIGLLICRDVRDKKDDKWNSFYEPGDADLVLMVSAWGDGGVPANGWMDFVEENQTALAVSNVWGKEANNDFGEGGVCVIEKSGKVHCDGLKWSEDCIVYAELKK